MAPLTSIENLPTKMTANYARGRIPYIKINQIHSFSNSHFGWSIVVAVTAAQSYSVMFFCLLGAKTGIKYHTLGQR